MTNLSRATSVLLIVVYFLYLWTQVRSAKYAYRPLVQLDDQNGSEVDEEDEVVELRRPTHRKYLSCPLILSTSPPLLSLNDSASCDPFGAKPFPDPTRAITAKSRISAAMKCIASSAWVQKGLPTVLLITSTGLISVCGEYLVSSVDHFVSHTPISKTMVGLIILPIVGNAAELVSSIMFASRKQIDLAFAVSIGSAIQIALFVTPLIVLIGWAMDRDMSLNLTAFESVTLCASSMLFLVLVFEDRCSVLKGVCLCAGYTVIA
jgi:Ca2+:H+ antiporter